MIKYFRCVIDVDKARDENLVDVLERMVEELKASGVANAPVPSGGGCWNARGEHVGRYGVVYERDAVAE